LQSVLQQRMYYRVVSNAAIRHLLDGMLHNK